jgi:hypothetical protein
MKPKIWVPVSLAMMVIAGVLPEPVDMIVGLPFGWLVGCYVVSWCLEQVRKASRDT